MVTGANRILIVDDDTAFCETLSDILEEKGYDCSTAYTGKEAVKKIKKEKFDVVLMDINMPVMNGIDTFKQIKKDNPSTVVIMMSAYSLEDLMKDAIREGAYGVLRKPLDIGRVVATIEAAKEEAALVLVIDDDINTRKTLRDILTQKGFAVTAAKSGEEAIRIAKARPYDIILVDVKLPVLNGLETFLAIKDVNPKVKAIFMTAYREETGELVREALKKGIYACLYKPFEVEEAVELVTRLYKGKK